MATIIPMGIALVNNRFGGDVKSYRHHATSDERSATPDSFVVTPEGQALPGNRELHVDADGSLRIVDRVPQNFKIEADSTHVARQPQVPDAPFLKFPTHPPPMLTWPERPRLTWNKPFDAKEHSKKKRETVQIFVVAEDGTTEIKEVAMREFQRRNAEDAQEFKYVVEEDGCVHRAHCVFVAGPEADVVLRADGDDGAVYDAIRTPQPTLSPFSDIVFVAEENGKTHCGTNVIVADNDGHNTVLSRVAVWPALFVKNTTNKPMYIAYTAPPQIQWKSEERPDKSTDECFVVEHADGVIETYNRILLAANESVFLAYRSASDADAVIVSDGKSLRTGCLIQKPRLNPDMTPVIISGPSGVNHYGVNVFLSSPNGFIPVGRVASVSKDVQAKKFQEGLTPEEPSLPLLVGWPQRLCLLNEPHKSTACATWTLEDKLATKYSSKVPRLDDLSPSAKRTPVPVIIGCPDGPGMVSYLPPRDTWAGALLCGDGPLKLGHSVINLGTKADESSVTYKVDEES